MISYKSRARAIAGVSSVAILSSAFLGNSALAQDAANDEEERFSFEEIVVTARRRSESLKDVPGSVSVVSASTIRDAGVERAEDFIALTPGVSIVDAAEVGDSQVNIRGINGSRDAENSFAFVLDGVLMTNPAAFNREFTNLSQIEIFKGPQGAIYGRNAAAGAIIATTSKPGNEFGMQFEASYGNNESFDIQGGVEGPLVEDKLAFRLGADYRTTDGFFRNSFQNNDAIVDRFEGYNVDGRLVWTPSDVLEVDTKVRYGEVDASSITFNATFHLPNFAQGANAPLANEDVNDHEFVFQPNIVSDNNQTAFEFSSKFDYDMVGMTLTGWVLYSDIENDLIADGTSAAFGFFNNDATCQQTTADLNAAGVTLPAPQILGQTPVGIIFTPDFSGSFFGPYTPTTCDGIQEQLRNQQDFSFELRLASDDDADLRWMAGIYFLDIDRQVGVSLNRDSGADPIRGLVQASGPNRTEALVYDDFDSNVYAVFGQVQYDVNDDVEISAALRYDREERSVSNLVPTDLTSTVIDLNFDGIFNDPLNPGLSSLVNPSGVIEDQERTFEELQPKVSVTWDVSDTTTLFASWGVGFKAGGFNNAGSAATVDIFINNFINNQISDFADQINDSLPNITDDYRKETSSAFEAGFKSSLLDGRLNLEGAAYYTDVTDSQFFEFFVGTFGLLRVVSNIDELELYGFEFAANARMTDWWSLYGGVSVTESEIKANASRPDTVGNKAPYTPDYTLNFGSQFDFDVDEDYSFLARADVTVVGPTWFHTQQGGTNATIFNPLFALSIFGPDSGALGNADFSNARRDAYTTLDVRAGIQGENWALMGFARNLTNTNFLEEVIPAPEFGGSFIHPGSRRSYGIELSYRF